MSTVTLARPVGRPPISDEGSEQVAIRYPVWMLKIVSELMRERGGPGVVDRATVMREVMARGFEAMGKSAK